MNCLYIRLVMLGVFCLAFGVASAADITTGLMAYYKLNETSGTVANDSSGNNNHGVLQNFAGNPWVAGKITGGLQFDGVDDIVTAVDSPTLRLPGDFTVAVWVNKAFDPSTWARIVGKGGFPNRNYTIWDFPAGDNRIHCSINDTSGGQASTVDSIGQIAAGAWRHIVVTRSGIETRVYFDGVLDNFRVSSAPTPVNADPLTLGLEGVGGIGYPGILDDVRIYNRTLTPAEVTALFNFTDAPELRSASATSATTVRLLFDQSLDPASAQNIANYQVNNGIAVTGAVLQPDQRTVVLTTGALEPQVLYTLTINNVGNTSVPPRTIAPNTTTTFLFNEFVLGGNLIAHYKFDETTGTTAADSSGTGNTGTLINFPAAPWVPGKINNALQFDGVNDVVMIPNNLVDRNVITISTWFKTNTTGTIIGYQGGVYPAITGGYVPVMYVGTDGRFRSELWNGASAPITSAGTVNDGAFHHAVLVVNVNTQSLYLDGVLVGTVGGAIQAFGGVNNQIGTGYGGGWPLHPGGYSHTNGVIDDLRIYTRALSAAEAQQLAAFPRVSIAAIDSFAGEPGTDTATFRISRTGLTTSALAVNFSLAGSAVAGTDYALTYGSGPQAGMPVVSPVTIPVGAAFVDVVLTPIDDSIGEILKDVVITITPSLSAYDRVAPTSTSATITDDEPVVTVQVTSPTAREFGPTDGLFTLVRVNNTTSTMTVNYSITGTATSGTDFTALSGTAVFNPGENTHAIPVTPAADALLEGAETVILTITPGAYTVGAPSSGTVTIVDLNVVSVEATDPDAYEVGVNPGVFTFTRTGDTAEPLTIPFTVGGSAVAGVDCQAIATSVFFDIGQTTATLTVVPIDDLVLRQDSIVTVTLTSGPLYVAGTPATAAVTIHTDPEIFQGASTITITPNPALSGTAVAFSGNPGAAAILSWQWSFGDGGTAAGLQASHTYVNPGIYEVQAIVTLADGSITTGKQTLFVGTGLIPGSEGAGATSPTGGLLLGGTGAIKGASGKLKVQFTSKITSFTGKASKINFSKFMSQTELQGRQGMLTIGTGALAQTYFFTLNTSGRGKGANIPRVDVNLKRKMFGFTVTENKLLADYLATIGASRAAPSPVINVPVTAFVADKIFVAMTFQLSFKVRSDIGSGTLRKK